MDAFTIGAMVFGGTCVSALLVLNYSTFSSSCLWPAAEIAAEIALDPS